jgi:hypothetical protein
MVVLTTALFGLSAVLLNCSKNVLRILITYEAFRILAAVVVLFSGLSGLVQVFICVAVLTAVVGLTVWVCNN